MPNSAEHFIPPGALFLLLPGCHQVVQESGVVFRFGLMSFAPGAPATWPGIPCGLVTTGSLQVLTAHHSSPGQKKKNSLVT